MSKTGRPVVIVVGNLAPYMHVLYERLAAAIDRPLHIIACVAEEVGRDWRIPTTNAYHFEVLRGLHFNFAKEYTGSNRYINPLVGARLRQLRPAVVILNDFSPTMLLAAMACRISGIPYGVHTDGVVSLDPGAKSWLHRMIRRLMLSGADFGMGASSESVDLLVKYGVERARTSVKPLFPAWTPDRSPPALSERPYDLLFCSRLSESSKGAQFFVDVVLGCLERGMRLKVRVTGDGPARQEMQRRLADAGIEAQFDGFVQQTELFDVYCSARLFLFPTRGDVWGIVVNEALQSDTLVISSDAAGAAREMLAKQHCGVVLPLDRDRWVDATLSLLSDTRRQSELLAAAREAIKGRTPAYAASVYLETLRDFLSGTPDPALAFWDQVKRNLDDRNSSLNRAGESSATRDATDLREQLVSYLDDAAPAYKEARAGAASLFGTQDALEAGQKFVTATGKNSEYSAALAKMSEPRKRFADGYASQLDAKRN